MTLVLARVKEWVTGTIMAELAKEWATVLMVEHAKAMETVLLAQARAKVLVIVRSTVPSTTAAYALPRLHPVEVIPGTFLAENIAHQLPLALESVTQASTLVEDVVQTVVQVAAASAQDTVQAATTQDQVVAQVVSSVEDTAAAAVIALAVATVVAAEVGEKEAHADKCLTTIEKRVWHHTLFSVILRPSIPS